MAKYKNFELYELIASDKAKELKIDNTPTFEVTDHLNELVSSVLQPLREDWGSGITISSGYRCKSLNSALSGSSDTSAHLIGYAADMVPANGKFDEFAKFVSNWLKTKSKDGWDQLIIEKNSKGSRWLHIGFKNADGKQRREIKNMEVK